MARTALTVNEIASTGLAEPAKGAANVDGHSMPNPRGTAWVEIANGGGASINVTVRTPKKVAGRDVAEDVIAIAAGATKRIGGDWDPDVYNQSDGGVWLDFSAVASVTIAGYDLNS